MKEKLDSRCLIQRNAKRIVELRDRIQETFKCREAGKSAHEEWARTCKEFDDVYDSVAFPGGYSAGLRKISAGDADAIEPLWHF